MEDKDLKELEYHRKNCRSWNWVCYMVGSVVSTIIYFSFSLSVIHGCGKHRQEPKSDPLASVVAAMGPEGMAAQEPIISDQDLWKFTSWEVCDSWDELGVLYVYHQDYINAYIHLEKTAYELFKRVGRIDMGKLILLRKLQSAALKEGEPCPTSGREEKAKNQPKPTEKPEY